MPDDKIGSVSLPEWESEEDNKYQAEILFKYMLELKRKQIRSIYEPNMRK